MSVGAIVSGSAVEAQAVTWPTFELDLDASSVNVGAAGCLLSCVGFEGSFGQGAENFSWTPTSATDSIVVDDFFNWQATDDGFGIEAFAVQTELVFATPDVSSTTNNGHGLVVQLWGDFAAGVLRWTEVASVTFAQGSTLDIAFDGIGGDLWHGSVSTGATFIGNLIEPLSGSGGHHIVGSASRIAGPAAERLRCVLRRKPGAAQPPRIGRRHSLIPIIVDLRVKVGRYCRKYRPFPFSPLTISKGFAGCPLRE